ncbi:hypothetical protein B9Z19DRAFT_1191389 [Tuber borchii]|uniref:Nephrocystin 3-like N-terminal domain-containing protein n=1 Tax=Tuber borchii TaxID=42251 RepID=A0A2T7A046_TUBBO|nr:hypothetical protein B9Z19DRAFT_1191389 [Tuber borchii]
MSRFFSNNVNSFNTVCNLGNNCTIADDRSQILTWLSPLDPRLRHQDIQDRRGEGVGESLLQTDEFRSWCDSSERCEPDNPVLVCRGDPGVGKSFISSLVIDNLCDQAGGRDATVTCFYFDRTVQKEQSSTNVLGALLKQVVIGLEEVPGEIVQAYKHQKNCIGGRRPQHTDIVKMLQTTTSKKRTFICIDALDECVPEDQVKLLDSLNQVLQKAPDTRIFLTERLDIRPKTENISQILKLLHECLRDCLVDGASPSWVYGILERMVMVAVISGVVRV